MQAPSQDGDDVFVRKLSASNMEIACVVSSWVCNLICGSSCSFSCKMRSFLSGEKGSLSQVISPQTQPPKEADRKHEVLRIQRCTIIILLNFIRLHTKAALSMIGNYINPHFHERMVSLFGSPFCHMVNPFHDIDYRNVGKYVNDVLRVTKLPRARARSMQVEG